MEEVAIIIPFYLSKLSYYDRISLNQCQKTLSNYPKIAIKPKDLEFEKLNTGVNFIKTVSFPNHYFENIEGYNKLLLSSEFYEAFLEYKFILIYQLDCFVFSDKLIYWCNQNWDYIGAPWISKTYNKSYLHIKLLNLKRALKNSWMRKNNNVTNALFLHNKVGNGGFSLRRVKIFYDLCVCMKPKIDFYLSQKGNLYNEDVFWSIEVNSEQIQLNIPDYTIGLQFAFEVPPIKSRLLTANNLPFGCHDWDKYEEYWKPVFNEMNFEIGKKLAINISI